MKGAYHFEFHIGALGGSVSAAVLVKNTENIFTAYQETTKYSHAANGATLILEAGDVVFLTFPSNRKIYDNINHHNSFSGHLLFTM